MTTLAADLMRDYPSGDFIDLPVIASDIIYQGAAVGLDASGRYAQPLVAGGVFAGFACHNQVDNSAGAAGAKPVRVLRRGYASVPISGVAQTDVGKPVWFTDDNAFTLTNTTDSASYARIVRLDEKTSGNAIIYFDAGRIPAAKITAASVAHNLNSTFSDTEVEAALNALGTAINSLITVGENNGFVISN